MRESKFNIYQYDELSAEAKEKAVDNVRETIGSMLCDFDADEYRSALKEIEKIFEIKVYDWSVGYPGTYSRWRFNENSRFSGLSDNPHFLVRYLDEVERYCRKGRFYSSSFRKVPVDKEHPAGLAYTKRYSKVMFERNYCLTGTWTSAVVDEYMEKRWDYVRRHRTIEDFVDDMLYDFFKSWESNQECNYEDEAIIDTILGNDYEFTEDGMRYVA
jgi:hypothetical protein